MSVFWLHCFPFFAVKAPGNGSSYKKEARSIFSQAKVNKKLAKVVRCRLFYSFNGDIFCQVHFSFCLILKSM